MKNYPNIETRKFSGNAYYTGYSADGRSWRISGRHGAWYATANLTRAGSVNMLLMRDTLAEISAGLAEIF